MGMHYVSNENRNFELDLPKDTKPKTPILFCVETPDVSNTNLWENPELFSAWHTFYMRRIEQGSAKTIDFISGSQTSLAQFHPKKILLSSGNAKLVSANDDANFVFRGIFRHPKDAGKEETPFKRRFGLTDAVAIGYESSQKAHQFLRYLIESQGIACGEQVIVPFANRTGVKSLPAPPVTDEDEDWGDDELITTADVMTELGTHTGLDYAKSIRKALSGFSLDRLLEAHAPTAIAIIESVTTGRLSITYYRELARDEYLENICKWHENCKWPLWRKAKDNGHPFVVFGAPSFDRILQASFGHPRGANDLAYQKLKQRVRAQLMRSVFDNIPLPRDFIVNAVHRASNPLAFSKNGTFERNHFLSALATTCAVLKHSTHNTKESFEMSIDLSRTDRDYLFGRLLGAADKLEEYALRKKSNDRLVTAAIRYMQTFSMRPATTWTTIHNQLLPYIQQVKGAIAFREIEGIMKLGTPDAFADDAPLSSLYLVGFYHERAHIDQIVESFRAKQTVDTSVDTAIDNNLNQQAKE